jgi:hypothetical protein
VPHDYDSIREVSDLLEAVRDEQHAEAKIGPQRVNGPRHASPFGDAERGGRFVQD